MDLASSCRYCGKFKDDGTSHNLVNHYKSAFHKFNFERKNYMMPVLSEEEFELYVAKTEATSKDGSKNSPNYCETCKKEFNSEKSYLNHTKTNKHIKKQTRVNNKIQQVSDIIEEENTSDYSDEKILLSHCIICQQEINPTEIKQHLNDFHNSIVPNFMIGVGLTETFIDMCIQYMYDCNGCITCVKSFSHIENLTNHVRDKSHVYPSNRFIHLFFEHISNYMDVGIMEELYAEFTGSVHAIDGENLGLITPNGNKTLHHRKLVSKVQNQNNLCIIPKLHIGLKQINELSRIPVDYNAVRENLEVDLPDNKLKQLVLYELSRKACVARETGLEDQRNDTDKSAYIRQHQKLDVQKGIQMNKVHRPLPKKLMYL